MLPLWGLDSLYPVTEYHRNILFGFLRRTLSKVRYLRGTGKNPRTNYGVKHSSLSTVWLWVLHFLMRVNTWQRNSFTFLRVEWTWSATWMKWHALAFFLPPAKSGSYHPHLLLLDKWKEQCSESRSISWRAWKVEASTQMDKYRTNFKFPYQSLRSNYRVVTSRNTNAMLQLQIPLCMANQQSNFIYLIFKKILWWIHSFEELSNICDGYKLELTGEMLFIAAAVLSLRSHIL